ncbi:transketolase C-terminal domain-containing protein [Eggerthella sp. YY7918]|uniref:transketolase C-terminal domain-containing protein n=1 Tax=Eggerthella sp. (strain YY7918) TaxID=502558 RepID=UPI0002171418|nr:transketolase C-terminal domain-containing protein [Eggerthella sp. YY7918]BAK45386.1 pyruvate:ferredoxin oxidoreductase [Eggerthella sp. YY7918]
MKRFLSGDEALAEGVRLARPQVISAYPITPQTVVVERLSEMVESGELAAEYVHVESEHSALSCAIGASATGARTFTATSSQGLLYMAECLTYASGGRFPIVMMNANRATALPWNIYGDQRDSLALLDHGWIQVYAEDNQEALDLALMAYALAEDARIMTPVMVNLDGFALTHTYETVDVPSPAQADAFLPPYSTASNRFDFEHPVNIGYSAGPEYNRYYKYWEHRDMLDVPKVVDEIEQKFAEVFGRRYSGMIECVECDDAEVILVTLGSTAGLARSVVKELRAQGVRAGLLRIRYLRPMPSALIAEALRGAKAVAVLEQDISFGAEGTVFTNVNSVLQQAGVGVPTYNFIGGLGGDDISEAHVFGVYETLLQAAAGTSDISRVSFLGIDSPAVPPFGRTEE